MKPNPRHRMKKITLLKSLSTPVLALVLLLCSALSWADQTDKHTDNGSITFSYSQDNDAFSLFPSDRYYTNGLRLTWLMDKQTLTPDWTLKMANAIPFFPLQQPTRHGYTFGQNMYTPSRTNQINPDLDDRPYAGWLYAAIGLAAETDHQLDMLTFTVGVVGPASGAEQTQKFIHELINSPEPLGWDSQLENELGLNMAYQRSWRGFLTASLQRYEIDITPHISGALGNVYTFAGGGVTLRFGPDLPNDYGAPRLNYGLPSAGVLSPMKSIGWYVFAGVEGRAVAHNIFLDGNTFVDSRQVDREVLISDLQLGLVLDWPKTRISYSHIYRSKEFKTQADRHGFATLSFTFKY